MIDCCVIGMFVVVIVVWIGVYYCKKVEFGEEFKIIVGVDWVGFYKILICVVGEIGVYEDIQYIMNVVFGFF